MPDEAGELSHIEQRVAQLFDLVSTALAGATDTLLGGQSNTAQQIADADQAIDDLADEVTMLVWDQIESLTPGNRQLRQLVALLLIVPELERSGDLAEHIGRRAANGLGSEITVSCRGIIQRMGEVASEMWQTVSVSYQEHSMVHDAIDNSDEEIDILHGRLTSEIESGKMPFSVALEVTLIARFYERLGDHAVNLAKRIGTLSGS